MYPWLIIFLVLGFPVAEALSIFWMASHYGWWTLVWLAVAFLVGVNLIRFERVAFAPRMLFTLQQGQTPFKALFTSARLFLAGGLLMFPGFISDVMALVILMLPGTWQRPRMNRAANDDSIEGVFSRESESISDRFPRRDN